MPIPQPIQDALTALQADADQVAFDTAADAAAALALANATAAKAVTAATLATDTTHQATDLAALVALLQSTYGGGPPH